MAKYKAYPEYKDSGVEWLGDVPGEWDVINIKYLSQVKEVRHQDRLMTLSFSTMTEIMLGYGLQM